MPLYDAGARFYAPSLGVFTQADSVAGSAQDPASLNRYLYTAANPATLIDPDGHAYCGPDGILCGAHPTSSHPAARAKHHAPARHHAPPRRRLSGELDAIGHDRGRTILRHSQASHSRTISRLVRARETRTEIDGLGHDRGRTIARRTQNLTRAQVSRLAGVGKVDTDGFIHERGRTIARRTQTSRLAQAAVAAAETAATDARESRTLAATAARGGPNASDNTALHMALGAVGFIPVIGTAANLADAAVYASEGDYLGATLSAAAAVPLLGEGADAVKEARLAGKALDEGAKLAEEARGLERAADIADDFVVARGGVSDLPPAGTTFSGAYGRSVEEAAAGVPHGQVRFATAGSIRAEGGSVRYAPEFNEQVGKVNYQHVDVCLADGSCAFGPLQANPVAKVERFGGPDYRFYDGY